MRDALARELTRLAAADDRLVVLAGDIGNHLFDDFKRLFAERFYNCGIAEANMTGVAAGLAQTGLRPVTYTIAPFNTVRCLEQIRVDVCYQNLPVIIVGLGAGLSYSDQGATHQALEDLAVLRSLPNLSIVCPADPVEVGLALRAAFKHDGPVYLRLGKKKEPVIHEQEPDWVLGRGLVIRTGKDLALISTGNILPEVIGAAALLEKEGLSAEIVNMATVKPLDLDLLEDIFARFPLVATIEEHSLIGGLGSSVAEWMADRGPVSTELLRFGVPDTFLCGVGNQAAARKKFSLDAPGLARGVMARFPGTTPMLGTRGFFCHAEGAHDHRA